MKYKDNQGNWQTIALPSLDSMPVGTEVDFDGTAVNIPTGWEETTSPIMYGIDDRIYQTAAPNILSPSGDGTNPAYWCSIPNGTYLHSSTDGVTNMPASWGYVVKDGYYATDGTKGDFSIMFYQQATGNIWRTSANGNTTTCVWRKLIYEDALADMFTQTSFSVEVGVLTAYQEKYNQTLTITIPDGYKCLGIVGITMSGNSFTNCVVNQYYYPNNSNTIKYGIKNTQNASTGSITITFNVLLVKTS